MKNRWISVAVAAVLGAAARLDAQDGAQAPASGDTLDLPRAIALARAHNPTLAARAAEVRAAAARIAPAGTLPDPLLTLGAMNYMLPSLSARRDPLSMNQVTLMQTVPINGTLGLRRQVARADSARVAFGLEAAALQVERDVRAAYWDLYHDDRALDIMTRRRAVLQDIANVATTMYATGAAVQSDALRAQVAITRLDQEIVEMRLQRYAAAARLNALLGRPGETPVPLRATGETEAHGAEPHALDMPEPLPLDALAARSDERNPEILAARASVDGSHANLTAARRLIIPDLGLGVAYGQRFGSNDMLSLMVSVSVPLYARGRQLRMREEASATSEAAEQELAAARVRVRSALATARAQAETARQLVGLYARTLVRQADASYQAALAAYRVGRVDFPTLLDAQTALLEYEHDLHLYEAMYGTAVAELDRLTGRRFGAGMEER